MCKNVLDRQLYYNKSNENLFFANMIERKINLESQFGKRQEIKVRIKHVFM